MRLQSPCQLYTSTTESYGEECYPYTPTCTDRLPVKSFAISPMHLEHPLPLCHPSTLPGRYPFRANATTDALPMTAVPAPLHQQRGGLMITASQIACRRRQKARGSSASCLIESLILHGPCSNNVVEGCVAWPPHHGALCKKSVPADNSNPSRRWTSSRPAARRRPCPFNSMHASGCPIRASQRSDKHWRCGFASLHAI